MTVSASVINHQINSVKIKYFCAKNNIFFRFVSCPNQTHWNILPFKAYSKNLGHFWKKYAENRQHFTQALSQKEYLPVQWKLEETQSRKSCWEASVLHRKYALHDDVIKWKHFPRNWPFVREIHRSPVNFPHKGQWRGPLMFSLIYAWINDWVNNCEAGDLRRQHGHYDVIVMTWSNVDGTWYICPTTPYFVNRPQF